MSTIVGPHLWLALAQCSCGCLPSSINVPFLFLISFLIGQQEDFKIPQCVGDYIFKPEVK